MWQKYRNGSYLSWSTTVVLWHYICRQTCWHKTVLCVWASVHCLLGRCCLLVVAWGVKLLNRLLVLLKQIKMCLLYIIVTDLFSAGQVLRDLILRWLRSNSLLVPDLRTVENVIRQRFNRRVQCCLLFVKVSFVRQPGWQWALVREIDRVSGSSIASVRAIDVLFETNLLGLAFICGKLTIVILCVLLFE